MMMPGGHMVDQSNVSSQVHQKNGLKGRNALLHENPKRNQSALNPVEIVRIPHKDSLTKENRGNGKILLLKTCAESWTNRKRIPQEEIEEILNHHQEGLKLTGDQNPEDRVGKTLYHQNGLQNSRNPKGDMIPRRMRLKNHIEDQPENHPIEIEIAMKIRQIVEIVKIRQKMMNPVKNCLIAMNSKPRKIGMIRIKMTNL